MMGVLLQAFYKSLPNNAVPSPADGPDSFCQTGFALAAHLNRHVSWPKQCFLLDGAFSTRERSAICHDP
jgi:hypothetical protein